MASDPDRSSKSTTAGSDQILHSNGNIKNLNMMDMSKIKDLIGPSFGGGSSNVFKSQLPEIF